MKLNFLPTKKKKTHAPKKTYPAFAYDTDEALRFLSTSKQGLSSQEVYMRREKYGRNELPRAEITPFTIVFLRQFLSPFIYVLFFAAAISLLLNEWSDALFIFIVLLINAIIGSLQEYHAQKSALALQEMVKTTALAVRSGEQIELNANELVPGDICILRSGFKVPADIRLIETQGLEVDESLLTGESTVVIKSSDQTLDQKTMLADRTNMVFAGSLIQRGRALGVISSTGCNTEIGQLTEAVTQTEEAPPPLINRMAIFTKNITICLLFIILVLSAIEWYQGLSWHQILITSVALAVSAIPEGLPVAITIALAIGMNRMSKRNVLIRRLPAAESLGSCTLIASDKTGTLTVNELTVKQVIAADGRIFEVTGTGLDPHGEFLRKEESISEVDKQWIHPFNLISVLCNEAIIARQGEEWHHQGDMVDIALLIMAHKANTIQSEALLKYPPLQTIPYEPENAFSASLNQNADHQLLMAKGGPEKILSMCSSAYGVDFNLDQQIEHAERLASAGYRVIALARKILNTPILDGLNESHLTELEFMGFVGMIDPLRPETKQAVNDCRSAGIEIRMVTGDHPSTAMTIAKELGITRDGDQVVTGQMLKDNPRNAQQMIQTARVFARVEPTQKLDIVQSYIESGHFVAVTGDGANDAPALTAANIGVAMGDKGTDVARESADMIITDDKFSSIVAGVKAGRIAYQNIRKVIFLLISTGAAELVLFTLSLLSGLPLPLLAVQLLWLNLVTNGIQHIGLTLEPSEGDEMRRAPRATDEAIFNPIMIKRVVLCAITTGVIAFLLFSTLMSMGWEVETARNYTLLLMVLFENVNVFNSRSETLSAFIHNPLRNKFLLFATLAAQLIHILAMYTPGLKEVLQIEPISLEHWGVLFAIAINILFIMETQKWLINRNNKNLSKSTRQA